jgi:glutamine synthetase
VYVHTYDQTVALEASCALTIARTMVLPAALEYQRDIGATLAAAKSAGVGAQAGLKKIGKDVGALIENLIAAADKTEKASAAHESLKTLAGMKDLRAAVDSLEGLVPHDRWPLPSYGEMFFLV